MTIAELAVLGVFLGVLLWLFRPLQRAVRNLVERFLLRGRHGKVIEGRFKAVSNDDPKPPDSKV